MTRDEFKAVLRVELPRVQMALAYARDVMEGARKRRDVSVMAGLVRNVEAAEKRVKLIQAVLCDDLPVEVDDLGVGRVFMSRKKHRDGYAMRRVLRVSDCGDWSARTVGYDDGKRAQSVPLLQFLLCSQAMMATEQAAVQPR